MNKNTCNSVTLATDEVSVYDFGTVKLHAYKTNDLIDNEVFIVEKSGKAVVIESPCFRDNISELTEYLNGIKVEGVLVAYHGAGATFLPDVPKYATQNAVEYSANGGGKALITKFTAAFADAFDNTVHQVTNVIGEGKMIIGGIEFVIHPTHEAFDIEIPEINAVYTHMLGHDCHSIVAGAGHADAIISQLRRYIEKGYCLILTSHYTPEDLKDAETKIAYLEDLKVIAAESKNAEEFREKVSARYPQYSGRNYLCKLFKRATDMTLTDYINYVRVRRAAEMLRTTDRNSMEIAYACGFASQQYFNRIFKREFGQTPKAYRTSQRIN